MENRRVLELVRTVEGLALDLREARRRSAWRLTCPASRSRCPSNARCIRPPAAVAVESVIATATEQVDTDLLFTQTFIDQARLAEDPLRTAGELLGTALRRHRPESDRTGRCGDRRLPPSPTTDVSVEMDPAEETVLDYPDPADPDITRRARLPKVTVRRQ